jgi:exonuclease VII small subunit
MGNFGVNMSYCRFENTVKALEECLEDLNDNGIEELEEKASEYEKPHIKGLIELCKQVAEEYEHEIGLERY